jgi:hypothetical protein
MRTLLVIVIILAGMSAPEAAPYRSKAKRYYHAPRYYYAPRHYYAPGAESECERRARAEDPTGLYAGYPCWARETFGRGQSSGRGR